MKICLGFFGFMRIMFEKNEISRVFQKFPKDAEIDIYIYIPNTLNEFNIDNEYLNTEKIYQQIIFIFQLPNVKNIYIDFFDYNPETFIIKTKQLQLEFINKDNFITYRIISLINSITELCKFIQKNNITPLCVQNAQSSFIPAHEVGVLNEKRCNYDCFILTRFDIFKTVQSFGDCIDNTLNNNIHIWRTTPYFDNSHAEDRIIISSKMGIDILSKYYDNLNNIDLTELSHEVILGKYLNMFNELEKLNQNNININMSPFLNAKYNPEFINKCFQLWEKVKLP